MNPIETAAKALSHAEWEVFVAGDGNNAIRAANPTHEDQARAVLASLAQHRDDIARVLHNAGCPDGSGCISEPSAWGMYYRQVDKLLAYLTREAS